MTLAEGGQLTRINDGETLKKALSSDTEEKAAPAGKFKLWKGRLKNERNSNPKPRS